MVNIILLFVCLGIGLLIRRVDDFPEETPVALNQFVIYISLPSLALAYIPQLTLSLDLLYPILTSWLVLLFSLLIIPPLGTLFSWDRKTVGCLIMTAGFGNTSFVGFPIIEALYGAEGMKIALMVDQPGSFVAITTAGIVIASVYSSGKTRKRMILRKILLFPPFITFLIALGMNLAGIRAEGPLLDILTRLGDTIVPLALISVGMQLRIDRNHINWSALLSGLGYKLILAPAALFVLYVMLLGGDGLVVEVSIMEAAMAPMIAGSILAMTYGLNPRLATLMVGIGVPFSFLTVALWYLFLGWAM